jgi:hypothetical protein
VGALFGEPRRGLLSVQQALIVDVDDLLVTHLEVEVQVHVDLDAAGLALGYYVARGDDALGPPTTSSTSARISSQLSIQWLRCASRRRCRERGCGCPRRGTTRCRDGASRGSRQGRPRSCQSTFAPVLRRSPATSPAEYLAGAAVAEGGGSKPLARGELRYQLAGGGGVESRREALSSLVGPGPQGG